MEEAKLKAKFGGLQKPGGSQFLQTRLNKGVSHSTTYYAMLNVFLENFFLRALVDQRVLAGTVLRITLISPSHFTKMSDSVTSRKDTS